MNLDLLVLAGVSIADCLCGEGGCSRRGWGDAMCVKGANHSSRTLWSVSIIHRFLPSPLQAHGRVVLRCPACETPPSVNILYSYPRTSGCHSSHHSCRPGAVITLTNTSPLMHVQSTISSGPLLRRLRLHTTNHVYHHMPAAAKTFISSHSSTGELLHRTISTPSFSREKTICDISARDTKSLTVPSDRPRINGAYPINLRDPSMLAPLGKITLLT